MRKILPIKECGQELSDLLMIEPVIFILYQQQEAYEYVLAENFIDVLIYDNEVGQHVAFDNAGYCLRYQCFDCCVINSTIAKTLNPLSQRIVDAIKNDYYAYIVVDTFYFSNYPTYQKEHFVHKMMIYGYDEEKKVFFTTDFFTFQKRMFAQEVDFQSIDLSTAEFYNSPNVGRDEQGNANFLEFFKLNPNLKTSPSPEKIKWRLQSFLDNIPLENYEGMHFGIQFFDFIMKWLRNGNTKSKYYDFILTVLFITKQRMDIVYRQQNRACPSTLSEELTSLFEMATVLKNQELKYHITHKETLREDIISKLQIVKEKLAQTIRYFIQDAL